MILGLSGSLGMRKIWLKATFKYYRMFLFLLQLIGVDVIAALDMYVQNGNWEKCIQEAQQQVRIYCNNNLEFS